MNNEKEMFLFETGLEYLVPFFDTPQPQTRKKESTEIKKNPQAPRKAKVGKPISTRNERTHKRK